MHLSFREQAAIALYVPRRITTDDNGKNGVMGLRPEVTARAADELAAACCERWGHDWNDGRVRCRRCGQKSEGS